MTKWSKIVAQAHVKSHVEWDHLPSLAKKKYEMRKPFLVWLAFDSLLQVLGIKFGGVGSIPQDAHERIKKDQDLQTFIHTTQCTHAKKMIMAWDDTY